jgi:hypothetical protein
MRIKIIRLLKVSNAFSQMDSTGFSFSFQNVYNFFTCISRNTVTRIRYCNRQHYKTHQMKLDKNIFAGTTFSFGPRHILDTSLIFFSLASNVYNVFLKVPSHQIRLTLKWCGWIGFHEYKNRAW